jgi:hypothetical protein
MTTLTSDSTVRVRRHQQKQRATRAVAQPDTKTFDRDYWLRQCEGYRVDGAEGRLGFVDSIRDEGDGEAILAVRAGRLGRRLLLVRARDVAFIVPRAQRIWLAAPTEIIGSEAAQHRRSQVRWPR